jgi:hypothetical protein
MNPDIAQIHQLLLARHGALAEQLGSETDPAKAGAIFGELQEILHRVNVAQSLLFRQSVQSMAAQVKRVREADAKLNQALKTARTAQRIIQATSSFLERVDRVLDFAKTLAVL